MGQSCKGKGDADDFYQKECAPMGQSCKRDADGLGPKPSKPRRTSHQHTDQADDALSEQIARRLQTIGCATDPYDCELVGAALKVQHEYEYAEVCAGLATAPQPSTE